MIYIIETPLNNYIKLGFWSSSLKALQQRYVTCYGRSMTIWHIEEDDIKKERAFHKQLKHINIDCELYPLDKLDCIKDMIEGELHRVFQNYNCEPKIKVEKVYVKKVHILQYNKYKINYNTNLSEIASLPENEQMLTLKQEFIDSFIDLENVSEY